MNDNLSTEPSPRDQLLEALDPQDDIDPGLVLAVADQLDSDAQAVLAELIHKRVSREVAAAYDRGWRDHAEGTG